MTVAAPPKSRPSIAPALTAVLIALVGSLMLGGLTSFGQQYLPASINIVGAAAALTRHGRGVWRAIGVTPLSAVRIGEGIYGLRYVRETTSPVYWTLIIVLGAALLLIANLRRRPGLPASLLSCGVTALGASAFLAACIGLLS